MTADRLGQLPIGRAEPAAPDPGAAPSRPDLPRLLPDHPGLDLTDVEREVALTRLFDAHHAQLVRLAVLLGAGQDAEDLVAEAFCELHRRWYRLRSPEAASAYLRSVVCNLARMRLRHLDVVRRHAERTDGQERELVESAESAAVLREDQREVVDALAHLPARQREALVLRYWLGLRETEIAAAMGISAGAVKAHTSRGMAALTRRLRSSR